MKYNSFYRIVSIVAMAFKFLFQIIWFNWSHRVWDETTTGKWERLLTSQAIVYRKKALMLEGLLIKFGQFLSTRADLLPEVFLKELEGLVDRVDPVPFEFSKQTLEEEWGCPLEDYLESMSDHPVASASIGEVYKARLHNGTDVAIKIRRYRVKEIFHTDFKALKIVFWMVNRFTRLGKKADLPSLYNELVRTTNRELDFQQELGHGLYFKERYKESDDIYVPKFYEDLSTRKILVMEWIEGAKVTDLSFIKSHHIEREYLAKRIFHLFVDQFLNDGYFHADPHPGNLLLKADGTLVMIDFGMVGEVKKEDTKYIKNMIKGFVFDDYDAIIEALKHMHFLLPHTNEQRVKNVLKDFAAIYLSNDVTEFDAGTLKSLFKDLQAFVKEQPIQLPADFAFLGRAGNIVMGVLTVIYPSIDLKEWGKPLVKEWMTGKNQSDLSFYTEIIRDSVKPLLYLPQSIINKLNEGERERHLKKEMFYQKSLQKVYMFYAVLTFIIFIMGLGMIIYGDLFSRNFFLYGGEGITVIACGLLVSFFIKLLNIIKQGGF